MDIRALIVATLCLFLVSLGMGIYVLYFQSDQDVVARKAGTTRNGQANPVAGQSQSEWYVTRTSDKTTGAAALRASGTKTEGPNLSAATGRNTGKHSIDEARVANTPQSSGFVTPQDEPDIESIAEEFLSMPAGEARNAQLMLLSRLWAEIDPNTAAEWLLSLPPEPALGRALEIAGAALAASDPITAAEMALSLVAGQTQDQMLGIVAASWAQTDLHRSLAWIELLDEGPAKRAALNAISPAWIDTDPFAAAEYAQIMPLGAARAELMMNIASLWSTIDPDAAVEWAESLTDEKEADRLLAIISKAQPRQDALVSTQDTYSLEAERRALLNEAAKVAASDPEAAALLALSLDPGEVRNQAIAAVAETWAHSNLAESIAWMEGLSDEKAKLAVLNAMSAVWVEADPDYAADYAQDMPAGEGRDRFMRNVASEWVAFDPESATAWGERLPEEKERNQVLETIFWTWAEDDPAGAAGHLVVGTQQGKGQKQVARVVVTQWIRSDPSAAADWAASLPEGNLRETALMHAAAAWSDFDPAGVEAWLQRLPGGPSWDAAASAYVTKISPYDPEEAVLWAESISDETKRRYNMETVAMNWLELDEEAARWWLIESDLPEEVKSSLLDS